MDKGKMGEKLAELYLEKQGYKIVARNVRSPFGEIDLIASMSKTLCFVEVKLRTGNAFGMPGEAVGWKKQKRLKQTALWYLSDCRWNGYDLRMDVIEIYLKQGKPYFRQIENAF